MTTPMRRCFPACLAVCGCLLLAALASGQQAPGYHLLHKLSLPAAPGGGEYFDYLYFDPGSRRLFVSQGTAFHVLDGDSLKILGTVTGLKRDHGVAVVPALNRGFISDGDAAEVAVFDLKTFQITRRIPTAKDSDGILYDPVSKRVFCFEGDPNSVSIIDPASEKVLKTLPLGGSPEQAVADGKGMIYDNLADKGEVVAINAATMRVVSRWPVAPAGEPTAMAMDRAHRRLFIAGRKPASMIVMNADTGKLVGPAYPIGARVDSCTFDAGTALAACSTGDGTIHILHEDSPNRFHIVQTVKTEAGAKTMTFDPETHRLFVDTADFATPAATAAQPHPRAAAKPGTLHVLVYGR